MIRSGTLTGGTKSRTGGLKSVLNVLIAGNPYRKTIALNTTANISAHDAMKNATERRLVLLSGETWKVVRQEVIPE